MISNPCLLRVLASRQYPIHLGNYGAKRDILWRRERILTKYQTKGDLAYEQIRHAILNGDISIGSKLTVTNLVDEFGLSPMPVREAITKLTQEGLVQSTPHLGARVAEFNYHEHLESSLIRSCIEKQLFQIALQFLDQVNIKELEGSFSRLCELLDTGDLLEFSRERHNFFQIIYSVVPLEELKKLAENYYERYQIFHYFVVKIAEEDGLDRTWELLSEIKSLFLALQEHNLDVCLSLFNQIQQNDFLIFARYLMGSLEKAGKTGDSDYDFLWSNQTLTPEKQAEIRDDIELFIRIRVKSTV